MVSGIYHYSFVARAQTQKFVENVFYGKQQPCFVVVKNLILFFYGPILLFSIFHNINTAPVLHMGLKRAMVAFRRCCEILNLSCSSVFGIFKIINIKYTFSHLNINIELFFA